MNRSLQSIRWSKAIAFTVFLLWVIPEQLLAQERTITGTVKSGDDKTGLPGANIFVEGTTKGTSTDADGRFSLEVSEGVTLIFSSIGYTTQKVAITTQTSIDVVLEVDAASLQEVVVIGYGTVERKDITSSVSSIGEKQLKDIPINSAAQAITGRLAGVQVTTSEGSPNASVVIRVRGGGSITQDNSPLYVVDGIQVENALSVIAPQDIQSIDVLKDASATAIYGARGANGVVIITTKGGKEMKTVVRFSALMGVHQLANKLDVMKPYDFVQYQYQRSRGGVASEAAYLNTYGDYADIENYKNVPFVDWQKKMFGRNALQQTYNVSVQGGTHTTQFNLSVTSATDEGIMLNTGFSRKLVNFRFNHSISSKVRTGFNVRYNNTIANGQSSSDPGSSSTSRLRQSIKYRPFLFGGQNADSYDATYRNATNGNGLGLINPLLLNSAEYKKDVTNVANLSGFAELDLTRFLSFRSTLGVDITNQQVNVFNDTITNIAKQNSAGLPMASITKMDRNILNNSNVLTFSLHKLSDSFSQNNKLDILIGQEIYQTLQKNSLVDNRYFPIGIRPDQAFANMALASAPTGYAQVVPSSSQVPTRLLSFFSRVTYSHADKYFATLTMRGDGSSKFAQGRRWGYFPSASLAWRLSSESFMENIQGLSNMKLRASYGQAGNNRIGDFLYLPQYIVGGSYDVNGSSSGGFVPSGLANNNLKWETTTSRNLGLDIGLFNDRIQFSVDVYKNTTNDLLLQANMPTSSGYGTQTQNLGATSNQGVEIQLGVTPVKTANFTWQANYNMSFNSNKVVSLGGIPALNQSSGWGSSDYDYKVMLDRSVGLIWGLVTDGYYKLDDFDYDNVAQTYTLKPGVVTDKTIIGVDPQPGFIKYKDLDGDGQVTTATNGNDDRTVLGNATPKFFGGLNQNLTYKNFDLSIFLNFQYGNSVLNANKIDFSSGYAVNSNLLSSMNNRWKNVDPESGMVVTDPDALAQLNQHTTLWVPGTSYNSYFTSSYGVEDGSFIRINNVTLGYSIPKALLNRARISQLRFYVTANNLAVFTKYSGYDPDVSTARNTPLTPGVDYSAYPRSHTYILGVNLSF